MDDGADATLWKDGFQCWRAAYEKIIAYHEMDGSLKQDRQQRQAVEDAGKDYYQLEELAMGVLGFAPNKDGVAVKTERVWTIFELMDAVRGERERMQSSADDLSWDDVECDVDEMALLGELAELLRDPRLAVRGEAMSALRELREINGLMLSAYAEVSREARLEILEFVYSQVVVGAKLGRDGKSTVLRMTEDFEPSVSEAAWQLAMKLLKKGSLDCEQMAYLACRASVLEDKRRSMDVLEAVNEKSPGKLGHAKADEVLAQFRRMTGAGLQLPSMSPAAQEQNPVSLSHKGKVAAR